MTVNLKYLETIINALNQYVSLQQWPPQFQMIPYFSCPENTTHQDPTIGMTIKKNASGEQTDVTPSQIASHIATNLGFSLTQNPDQPTSRTYSISSHDEHTPIDQLADLKINASQDSLNYLCTTLLRDTLGKAKWTLLVSLKHYALTDAPPYATWDIEATTSAQKQHLAEIRLLLKNAGFISQPLASQVIGSRQFASETRQASSGSWLFGSNAALVINADPESFIAIVEALDTPNIQLTRARGSSNCTII